MKETYWCKKLGHSWEQMYIKGRYSNIEVKFIACVCSRCGKGREDILDAIEKQTVNELCSYNEHYYK